MRFPCSTLTSLGLLLASSTAALAAPVTALQAQRAADAWLHRSPNPLRTRLQESAASVESHVDADGRVLFHEVRMASGGFVIMAPDDLLEPVVAFADQGVLSTDRESHLFLLLRKDLRTRLDQTTPSRNPKAPILSLAAASRAQSRWQDLLGTAPDPTYTAVSTISDVRVAPLVAATWNQDTDNYGHSVYNLFTPNHDVCGCVSTAMSQLIWYNQWPTTGIGVHSFAVTVEGVAQNLPTRGGDGAGGAYNWAMMPATPNNSTSDASRQMIGSLTYDAAVAVHMSFAADGSGAQMTDASDALKTTFKFANSYCGGLSGYTELTGHGLTEMVNPNLDAGYPVLFGISGDGGHAIVCDGYGYTGSTIYHHLNLGWGGSSNAWYNLPNIGTNYHFNLIDQIVYNAFPTATGELLSGRVTDGAGAAVPGVLVSDGTHTATTNAAGIYALKSLSAGVKTITATKTGQTYPESVVMVGTSSDGPDVGNVWGVNAVQGAGATPIISPAPAGKTAKVGDTVTFQAGASGLGPLHFQWTKNSVNVGTDSPVYSLTTVAADDQASIGLRVTGSQGQVASAPVTLNLVTLFNGDFESGEAGWDLSYPGVVGTNSQYTQVVPHGGSSWLIIGDWQTPTTDYAMQDITVPDSNSVSLGLWVGIANLPLTPATSANVFKVKVLDSHSATLATFLTLDNTNAETDSNGKVVWHSYGPFNLAPWKGQRVTLRIESVQPGANHTGTVFAVDDVTVTTTSGPRATVAQGPFTLVTGAQKTFAATVTGFATDNSVDWSVESGGGTFSPTRTAGDGATTTAFTAGSTPGTFHVTATPVEANSTADSKAVTLVAPSSVTVNLVPSATTVRLNQAVTLTSSVTPLSDTSVDWSNTGGAFAGTPGTTASWSSAAAGTFTVTATSHAAPSRAASTQIQVVDTSSIVLAMTPPSLTLLPGGHQLFTASGDLGFGVTFSLTGAANHVDSGLTSTVTVPSAAPLATTTYTLTATHVFDATKTAASVITVKGMDLVADGAITPRDLLAFAAEWGKGVSSPANFKGSGTVDDADLTALLNQIQ